MITAPQIAENSQLGKFAPAIFYHGIASRDQHGRSDR